MPIHSLITKCLATTALCAAIFLNAAETIESMLTPPPEPLTPTRQEHLSARHTIEMLTRAHFNATTWKPALSSQWFAEYFDNLDPQRIYFLQSDIEQFRGFETTLWDPPHSRANVSFAFQVWDLYLKRLHDFALFCIAELDKPQDFSIPETILIDRKKEPRPETQAEQQGLWRKLVKNLILSEIMAEERRQAREQRGELTKADKRKPKRTEEETLQERKKHYARIYHSRVEYSRMEILEIFLNSLCNLFDPHTSFMPPMVKEDFDIHMSLSLQGIGATLSARDGYITIVDLIHGGPADRDGRLKKGDRITAVAQEGKDPVDVIDMPLNRAVSLIRGKKDTKVTLTILPEGSSDTMEITLVRDEIKLENDEAKADIQKIDIPSAKKPEETKQANVLIMRLPSFYSDFAAIQRGDKNYKSTTRDMRALLEKAQANGKKLDGVILDLRGNGGGSLEEAIRLTGLFFTEGPVVQVVSSSRIERRIDPDKDVVYKGPILVLVDRFSASATEILAAALQDYCRAIIVGTRTHGKGTVQNIIDLSRFSSNRSLKNNTDLGSLKLTIAKFYRINGGATQRKGVTPNIAIPALTDGIDDLGEESIPHALEWDEIKPMPFQYFLEVPTLLPKLQERSQKRMAESPEFQNLAKIIQFYHDIRSLKEIPLEINARRKYNEQLEQADKIFRDYRRSLKDKNADDDEDVPDGQKLPPVKDLTLEETLHILADYIELAQP
ncbi:MAG: carboxy terminal-processing peptidase [Victivallales bacterium]|nr:carboxy terminal-processing peptidase [Victivallales bacterium]